MYYRLRCVYKLTLQIDSHSLLFPYEGLKPHFSLGSVRIWVENLSFFIFYTNLDFSLYSSHFNRFSDKSSAQYKTDS